MSIRTRTSGISFEVAPPPPPGLDQATQLWVIAVGNAGGTVSAARRVLVDAFVVGLKADGLWTKLDRLWLHAAENEPSALLDLIVNDLAVTVNAPTFTMDRGYTGDGATNYIDTTYNPSTDAINYVLDSASFGAWVVSVDAVIVHMLLGATTAADDTCQIYYLDGTAWVGDINQNAGSGNVFSTNFGSGPGMLLLSRTASNAYAIYGNGGSKNTDATASGAVPNCKFFVLARSSANAPNNYGAHQVAASYFGGGLSDADVANFYSRLRTYMTAVGVP